MDTISHKPLETLTIPSLLDRSAAVFADRPAISFQGRHWTYRELAGLVDRATAGLQRLGLRQGERVGLCLPNTPYSVIFYYAALKAGLVVVNYNPLYVARELRHQIAGFRDHHDDRAGYRRHLRQGFRHPAGLRPGSDHRLPVRRGFARRQAPRVFGPEAEAPRPSGLQRSRSFPTAEVIAPGAPPAPVRIDPSDLAVLQYTGGTTGVPKGAMLTHANLSINAQQATYLMPSMRQGEEKLMGVLPLFHVFAMTSILNGGVLMGSEMILHPRFEIGALMKSLVRDKPTIMHAVPTIYNAIATAAEAKRVDISSLRVCVSGGAPLPAEIRERFMKLTGCRVIEGYGLTEASPAVTSNPPGRRGPARFGRHRAAGHDDRDPRPGRHHPHFAGRRTR